MQDFFVLLFVGLSWALRCPRRGNGTTAYVPLLRACAGRRAGGLSLKNYRDCAEYVTLSKQYISWVFYYLLRVEEQFIIQVMHSRLAVVGCTGRTKGTAVQLVVSPLAGGEGARVVAVHLSCLARCSLLRVCCLIFGEGTGGRGGGLH